MNPVPGTIGTAWIAMAMLLTQASIGLSKMNRGILRGLHICFGVLLFPLVFIHAWNSMMTVSIKSANQAGLWLATVALLLLGLQLLLGTKLIRPIEGSGVFGKIHLAVGLVIICLVSVHVWLIK